MGIDSMVSEDSGAHARAEFNSLPREILVSGDGRIFQSDPVLKGPSEAQGALLLDSSGNALRITTLLGAAERPKIRNAGGCGLANPHLAGC